MRVVISSGHGLKIRGAAGLIDEVDEARRVVPEVAALLRKMKHSVVEFNDDTSTAQQENLETIVNFHNMQTRDLDVSVHFNAYEPTTESRGTEVWYQTQDELAADISYSIANASDLFNRGGKYTSDLYFLNHTDMPAALIEVCFVDSEFDVEHYVEHFEDICESIAAAINDHFAEAQSV